MFQQLHLKVPPPRRLPLATSTPTHAGGDGEIRAGGTDKTMNNINKPKTCSIQLPASSRE
eukprot:8572001-Pyramimonas_sp.AAC.1